MSHPRVHVPPELTSLLLEFTVNVLVERPNDLVDFAANYFDALRRNAPQPATSGSAQELEVETKEALPTEDALPEEAPPAEEASSKEAVDGLPTEEEDAMPKPSKERRKSVFAEQYNPEEDESQDEKVSYPKTDEQRDSLNEAVKHILLFRELDENQMQEVLDAMFERKVSPDEIVIRQGDDGDNFYVIESGIYNVYLTTPEVEEKLVGSYENSGSFGELALMYNMPRAATVQAVTEGSLWAMSRQTFRRIVLKSAFKKRQEYEHLLESVPMLKSLEKYERLNLCDALMPKTYEDGERIIQQGEEADGMYFVVEGVVKITMTKEGDNSEVEMSRLSKGSYFGELALVTHKPRAASVYAVDTVKVAFLDVQAFERLLGPCMDILRRNIDDYEKQVAEIFGGSTADESDFR